MFLPIIGMAQKVIYSQTIRLEIPAKTVAKDSVMNEPEHEDIINSTISFVNLIDSLQVDNQNIKASVDIELDTVFEDSRKKQKITFQFKPIWDNSIRINDFPSGTYVLDSTGISLFFTNIVKETLENRILNYVSNDDHILIKIFGSADATSIKGIPYKNEFGGKITGKYFHENSENEIVINGKSRITKNKELAFLRTYGIRYYLESNIPELAEFNVSFEHYTEVCESVGANFRSVSIEIIVEHELDD